METNKKLKFYQIFEYALVTIICWVEKKKVYIFVIFIQFINLYMSVTYYIMTPFEFLKFKKQLWKKARFHYLAYNNI